MKNICRKGKSLYFVEYLGRHQGKPRYKWHRLGPADMTPEELNGALWRLQNRGLNRLAGIMEHYIQNRLPKRAFSTQVEYERVIRARLMPDFGQMRPDDVSQQDVAMYLEMREQAGNGPGGNREMAVLSSVFNHGMRIGVCQFNPTYGVRRNEEHGRTRYVTDEELRLALKVARPALRYLLWATYLTGFRQGDMRRLTKDDLLPAGIRVRQSKDGKHELRLWTDSLRNVVRRALTRSQCDRVFTNAYGRPWTKDAVGNAMQRLKAKTGADWHFHDLRAKADSDHKQGLGLMRRYTRARKLKAVK